MPKQWVASQCFWFILFFAFHWSSVIKIGFPFWSHFCFCYFTSFTSHPLPKCRLSLEAFWLVTRKSTREDYLNPKKKSSLLQFKSRSYWNRFFLLTNLFYLFKVLVVSHFHMTDFQISYTGRKEQRIIHKECDPNLKILRLWSVVHEYF